MDENNNLFEAELGDEKLIEFIDDITWKEKRRTTPMIQMKGDSSKYLRGDYLGEGSFSKVFEALDMDTLERRAVKTFNLIKISKKCDIKLIKDMIKKEVRILTSLKHQNLIKLIDVIYDSNNGNNNNGNKKKDKIYIFLEYCFANVEELILHADNKKLSQQKSHKYFNDLINGLEYLHSQGIIHKDIKCPNMLISAGDIVKISDFGISIKLDILTKDDYIDSKFGTYTHMAPEVFKNKSFSGCRSDIWSCGIVLYHMMSGYLPFSSERILDLIDLIQNKVIFYEEVFENNPLLIDLLNGILTKEPEKRFTITEIKSHNWFKFNFDLPYDHGKVTATLTESPLAIFPPRHNYSDHYRSMTITPYLHELHYPLKQDENEVIISENEMETFRSYRKIAILRSNRCQYKKRKHKKDTSPFKRVNFRLLNIIGFNSNSHDNEIKNNYIS